MRKKIFENDDFIIKDSGKDYDFRYVIENKHNFDVNYYLIGLDDFLEIDKNSWIGLFQGDYSNDIIDCLIKGSYEGV